MKDYSFGEFHEAGISKDGKVYIWKKHVLDASVSNKDDVRNEVIELDSDKNNA